VHGQHHHPQGGALADELPRRLEPGELRHGDIEDREVELAGEAPCDRFGPVAGLLGDPQVRLAVEDRAEPLAHDRVVVGQEDHGDQRRGGGHPTGTRSRISRRRNAAVEARVDLKATVLAEAAAEADEVRDEVGDPPELRVSAVRLCPTSSCSSAARRRRSSSCADCVRRAVPALGLQSVEHLVKRRGEKGDLRLRTMDGDALPRRERSIVAIAARSRPFGSVATNGRSSVIGRSTGPYR